MLTHVSRFILACLALLLTAKFTRATDTSSQLIFFGTWPHHLVVFDSAQEKIVDNIDLKSDVPRTLILSPDKSKIYASTLNDNAIVTIDVATRKLLSSFTLNHDNQNVRLVGLAPDPTGNYLFAIATIISKKMDHYDVDPPKFIVIDLAAKKITRTAAFPPDEGTFGFRTTIKLSPDGKLLYLFRENILVFDTSEFRLVKKIDLAKPQVPDMENLSVNLLDDPNELPGKITSVFNTADVIIHRRVFGIGTVDLSNLSFDFTPIAPAPGTGTMTPLFLTPNRKTGYTVSITGDPGNRRCEFWAFDIPSRKLIRSREFDGRTRFSFGLSADGTKLLIYGAGYQITVYDAATFEQRSDVDVPGDMTTNLVVLPLASSSASAPAASNNSPSLVR
jgi:DNA-binding beta-propeller fold protein YncE